MNDLMTVPSQVAVADPAAVSAAEIAKTRLQAAYQVAMHRPRNQEQARQNLLAACRRLKFAEKAEYSKPVGGSRIAGPSIRFAETALREWGNIRSDISVVFEDDKVRRIQVNLIDFETNAQFTKELTIAKIVERKFPKDREVVGERQNSRGEKVFIVKGTDDEIANKEAAMISKAVRNEGLRLLPADIIDEALEVARETLAKNIKEDPEGNKRKVIDAFSTLGVKVASLEKFLGHEMDICSPAEIQELRNIFGSIKDGEASWSDYMELKRKSTSDNEEERKSAVDALASLGAKKTAKKKTATKKAAKPAEANPAEEPKAEAPTETKGQLIAEVMGLLQTSNRDQQDLIRWAIENKYVEEAETIQDFDPDLLKKFISNWEKIVL